MKTAPLLKRLLRCGAVWNILCAGYIVFLTMLLLSADPTHIVHMPQGAMARLMPLAHLLSFFVLAVLVLIAHWPLPKWFLLVLLLVYSASTEIAQGFLPPRTPEWRDLAQDVAGVLLGAAFYGAARLLFTTPNDKPAPDDAAKQS